LRKGLFLVLVHVLVLVLEMPIVKTGRQGSSSERLAGREFTLPDIQRKPASRSRTIGKPVTC
jgi:hypothetical protein